MDDSIEFLPAQGFIIRKKATPTPETKIWTLTPPYVTATPILPAPPSEVLNYDANTNGISDIYEDLHAGPLDPAADPTGDNYNNRFKYLFGGVPSDRWIPSSVATHTINASGYPQATWTGGVGLRYQVETSSDLITWEANGPVHTYSGQPLVHQINTHTSTVPRLFWRVRGVGAADTDGDRLNDFEEYLLGGNSAAQSTAGDGIRDDWKYEHGFALQTNIGNQDGDSDGLSNLGEYLLGTDPADSDSDNDGILDGAEDRDGDGMPDSYETAHGLDFNVDDTMEDLDGDRIPNIFECKRGTAANDPASKPSPDFIVDPNAETYTSIGTAVAAATADYQVIEVAPGTYDEVVLLDGYKLLLLGRDRASETILKGAGISGAETITIGSESVLDGFTITHPAGMEGRGISISVSGNVRIANCVIKENTGPLNGAGMSVTEAAVLVENSLFLRNQGVNGGAIANEDGAVNIRHCTFFENEASSTGDAAYSGASATVELENCIVWNSGSAEFSGTLGGISATCSNIRGGYAGAGNLSAAPQLKPDGHLTAASPGLNVISVSGAASRDFEGEVRPFGSGADVGADEFTDTDGDTLSDAEELALGTDPGRADTDLDGIDDAYEQAHGLDPLVQDSGGDLDGDGQTNLAEYTADTDPNDFFNGVEPQLVFVSGDGQTGVPGAFLTQAFVLRVEDDQGAPIANAPVTIDVVQGRAALAAAAAGTPATQLLTVSSDAAGEVRAYAYLPFATDTIQRLRARIRRGTDLIKPVVFGGKSSSHTAAAVSAGWQHSLALDAHGVVWGWGYNQGGKLGIGGSLNQWWPAQISNLTGVTALASGNYHNIALKADGTLVGWGEGGLGQLGNGGTADVTRPPLPVSTLTGVIAIAAGGEHNLALKTDGTVWAWGNNSDGQVKSGAGAFVTAPVLVDGLSDVIAIAAGGSHSLALKSDGSVWGWGSNAFGQIGDGTGAAPAAPVQALNLPPVRAIGAGWLHSMVVAETGEAWACGWNESGQLGIGGTVQSNQFVNVTGSDGFVASAGGASHSIALDNAGGLWAWGGNSAGQLGDSTLDPSIAPSRVFNVAEVVQAATKGDHGVAVTRDGGIWSWGSNLSGEIGDGDMFSRSVPVRVLDCAVDNDGDGFTDYEEFLFKSDPWSLDVNSDLDGLPDWWENSKFGGLQQDGSGDLDGDGTLDLDEVMWGMPPDDYYNGTQPVPVIMSESKDGSDDRNGWPAFGSNGDPNANVYLTWTQSSVNSGWEHAGSFAAPSLKSQGGVVATPPNIQHLSYQLAGGGQVISATEYFETPYRVVLSNQNTVTKAAVMSSAYAQIPGWDNDFDEGDTSLASEWGVNTYNTYAEIGRYKFAWKMTPETPGPKKVQWLENLNLFDQENAYLGSAELRSKSWEGTATETELYYLDPRTWGSVDRWIDVIPIDISFSPNPVTGSESSIVISVRVSVIGSPISGVGSLSPVEDGNVIEWSIQDGSGGELLDTQTETVDGIASVELLRQAGERYLIKAKLKTTVDLEGIYPSDPIPLENGPEALGEVLYTAAFPAPYEESAGARYRKISLAGRPLPDEKPQAEAETDVEPEETYVDAMTLGLNHATTDIYVPVPGSDLALSVRRNLTSEIWNNRSGISPSERPDRPFGNNWDSNITPNIHFVYENALSPSELLNTNYAFVTDEHGGSTRFAIVYEGGQERFFPLPSVSHQRDNHLATLEKDAAGNYVYRRKFGGELHFELAPGLEQTIPSDRLQPWNNSKSVLHRFARLSYVKDRIGNRLDYNYNYKASLVPSMIAANGNSSQAIRIFKNSKGLVSSIQDPAGKVWKFAYSSYNTPNAYHLLSTVTKPDGAVVEYGYEATSENEETAWPGPSSTYFHTNLSSIRDSEGNVYAIEYQFDTTRKLYASGYGYGTIRGVPRNVSRIVLPGGIGEARFENHSFLSLQAAFPSPVFNGHRVTYAVDAEGNGTIYKFTGVEVLTLVDFQQILRPATLSNSLTLPKMVLFDAMEVIYLEGGNAAFSGTPGNLAYTLGANTTALGTEVFEFDKSAGMALKKTTDFSGNITTFQYADTWNIQLKHPYFTGFYPFGKHGEPTSQINADSKTRQFQYDPTWRIMTRMVDEEQRTTDFEIDSLGRQKFVKTYYQGDLKQKIEYQYGDSGFPGFVTKKIVHNLGGEGPSLVTSYIADKFGRVERETIDPGGLGLTTRHTYDLNNNKLSTTDPNGNTVRFKYDELNRLAQVDYPPPQPGEPRPSKYFRYDGNGKKTEEINENGVVAFYDYDELNRLVQTATDLNGNGELDLNDDIVSNVEYNAVGSVTATMDPRGYISHREYDGIQRLTNSFDALNQMTEYRYDGPNSGGSVFNTSGFQPTTVVDPRGYRVETDYDSLYRATEKRVQYQLSPVKYARSVMEYDDVGNLTDLTQYLNATESQLTSTKYDPFNRPVKVTYADGLVQESFYSAAGLKTKTREWHGDVSDTRSTLMEYDKAGRVRYVRAPAVDDGTGNTVRPATETLYDKNSNIVATINPLGRRWDYAYDGRNRKIREEQPAVFDQANGLSARPVIDTIYDPAGNIVAVTDARGQTTDFIYDNANRQTEVHLPPVATLTQASVRPVTVTTYDKNGNVTHVLDANSHETENQFDPLNRLTHTWDANEILVENEYDEAGNRTGVYDGERHKTLFEYDGMNRNTKITDPAGRQTIFGYDSLNKISRTDALGRETIYGYDDRNRLETVNYTGASAENRTYDYDDFGNLQSVTEPGKSSKADVVYVYDNLNRVVNETSSGETHTYRYDLAGNRVYAQYGSGGRELVSSYDALNWLATLQENGRTTVYKYDLNGNALLKILPNGDRVETAFDALNRPRVVLSKSGAGGNFSEFEYTYDLVSNLRKIEEDYFTQTLADRVVTNTYEPNNRLSSESIQTGPDTVTTTYQYDDASNRIAKTVVGGPEAGVTNYVFPNSLNQLARVETGAGNIEFTYDLNGNRQTRTEGGQTDVYTYDRENRLVSLTQGANSYSYLYDYRTRRVERTENATTTKVVFSGGTSVQETEGGNTTVEYVRGSDMGGGVGGILYTLRGGAPSINHYNNRGDVIAKTNSGGALTYQASYEAYGTRTQEFGSTLDRQKANTKEEDPTGLLNEGFRYRDLEAGVFITRDPLGFIDGPNPYTYVRQNPWSKFDPEGLADKTAAGYTPTRVKHHISPVETWDANDFSYDLQKELDDERFRIGSDGVAHGHAAHNQYNQRVNAITKGYVDQMKIDPSKLSGKAAREYAEGLIRTIQSANDPYIEGFNKLVRSGATQAELARWGRVYKAQVIAGRTKDVWFRGAKGFMVKGGKLVSSIADAFASVGRAVPKILTLFTVSMAINEFVDDLSAGEPVSEAARTQYYRYSSATGETPEERQENDKNRSESFFNFLLKGTWETDAEREEREQEGR